jgi:two-component sensor histidine kinase
LSKKNDELRFLTDELIISHRIKNLVSLIQAIARQTMQQTTSRDDFEARFSGRMGALSRSLDLLIDDDWRGARIDDLVRLELALFGRIDGFQISAKGPTLVLNAKAARNLSLALHELATNASRSPVGSWPRNR